MPPSKTRSYSVIAVSLWLMPAVSINTRRRSENSASTADNSSALPTVRTGMFRILPYTRNCSWAPIRYSSLLINARLVFRDQRYKVVHGYVKSYDVSNGTDTLKAKVFSQSRPGSFTLRNPSMKFIFTNSLNFGPYKTTPI